MRHPLVLVLSVGLAGLLSACDPARLVPADRLKFDYAEPFARSFLFYEAQRAGAGPTPRIDWREPAVLRDGQDVGVDLSGGWFDAGDHVKFGLPMAYSTTMLSWSLIENRPSYIANGQEGFAEENLRFVLAYLLNAYQEGSPDTVADDVLHYQVGDGNIDHSFWGPPEALTTPRPTFSCRVSAPCSEVAGETAAAFAAASIAFRQRDPAFSELLRGKAVRLFRFADLRSNSGYTAANGFYTSFSGFLDEIAWAATWVFMATNDPAFLAIAQDTLERGADGRFFAQSWDNKSNGTSLLLARLTGERRYADRIEQHLQHWISGLPRTPGGLVFVDGFGSLRYASTTAFLALTYADDVGDAQKARTYREFALGQINYILGDNPRQSSYVVGFGNNPPKNPHHRAAHDSPTFDIDFPATNRHVLEGALVGGPKRADDFAYADDRRDFVANEVACDYNAGYTGALAAILVLRPETP